MKNIIWVGATHETVKSYSKNVKQEIDYNLDKLQRGLNPNDWKPMLTIGQGVKEIRIHQDNEYRVLYLAKFEEAIYVLHVFIKKSEKTLQKEIGLTRKRYNEILKLRGK